MMTAMDIVERAAKMVESCKTSVAFGAPEMHPIYLDRMVTDLNDLFIEAQGGEASATARLAAAKPKPVCEHPGAFRGEQCPNCGFVVAAVTTVSQAANPVTIDLKSRKVGVPLHDDGYRVRVPEGYTLFEYKYAELECKDPRRSHQIIEKMVELYNADAVTPKPSEITEGLVEMLRSRDAHGQKKYGTTLDRGDLSFDQWMQHLLEELLDGAGYIQAARRERRLADFRSGEARDAKS